MIIKINTKSETPIYLQLRNEVVKGIGKGEFEIGESLPTVRQMAMELGVNTMTVSKAYQLLKAEGFIETDRRKGTVVCNLRDSRRSSDGEILNNRSFYGGNCLCSVWKNSSRRLQ